MNGYVGFYKNKRFEVEAESSYAAQCKIAAENNIKKRWQITVVLAEKDGEQVTHKPDF
jgi:hypothetical protein